VEKYCPEAFMKACGATGCLGLRVEQGDGDQIPEFWFRTQPFAIAGRDDSNDVILKDQRVSRRHCYFQILGGEVFCVDLNSRTGIHGLAGRRQAGWVAPMQSLQLGGYVMRLLAHNANQPLLSTFDPMAGGCLQQALLTLEFLGTHKNHIWWPMNRMLALVGRALCCRIRLNGPEVTRVHASLVSTAHGSWVIDLHSRTGTWLNGQRVRLAQLDDGDELRIGNFVMRVHSQPSDRFALGQELAAALPQQSKASPVLHGQSTMLNLELPVMEVTPKVLIANPQALQHVVEYTAKTMLQSVVFPLVQQFTAAQDEMFDQFQQALTLMLQLFGGLQKEQTQFLRDELTKVQELTQEIQALRTELRTQVGNGPDRSLPTNGACAESSPTNGTSPRSMLADESPSTGTSPRSMSESVGERRGQSVENIHAVLCQRMAELQSDRRTRLQKIVAFLAGR
jgi:pSer/pThr/pTyr-binding forkhead associated (FHA) protein